VISKLFKILRKIIAYGISFNVMASVGYTIAKTVEHEPPLVYLTFMMISSVYTGTILLLLESLYKLFIQSERKEKHGR